MEAQPQGYDLLARRRRKHTHGLRSCAADPSGCQPRHTGANRGRRFARPRHGASEAPVAQHMTLMCLANLIKLGIATMMQLIQHIGRRIESIEHRQAGIVDRKNTLALNFCAVEQVAKSSDRIDHNETRSHHQAAEPMGPKYLDIYSGLCWQLVFRERQPLPQPNNSMHGALPARRFTQHIGGPATSMFASIRQKTPSQPCETTVSTAPSGPSGCATSRSRCASASRGLQKRPPKQGRYYAQPGRLGTDSNVIREKLPATLSTTTTTSSWPPSTAAVKKPI